MPRPFPLDLKPSRAAYPMWLRRKFRLTRAVEGKAYYDIVTSSLQRQFEQSDFWRDALANVDDYENAYRITHKDYGLYASSAPRIEAKDWDRFLDKTWRRNVVHNNNWPGAPTDGWLTPPDWFCSVKDIVRTLFVVKYMDGVLFLGDQLEQLARRHGLEAESSLEGTPAGYYAGHLAVRHLADLPLETWETEQRSVAVEIQITTQLHEVIRRLLHQHYERRRVEESDDDSWKWDHLGGEFQANYLGHILHYLDGQILRTRDE
jgi:hypothetical protein